MSFLILCAASVLSFVISLGLYVLCRVLVIYVCSYVVRSSFLLSALPFFRYLFL